MLGATPARELASRPAAIDVAGALAVRFASFTQGGGFPAELICTDSLPTFLSNVADVLYRKYGT